MKKAKLNKQKNSQTLVDDQAGDRRKDGVFWVLAWLTAETGQFTSMTNTGRVDVLGERSSGFRFKHIYFSF